ncbi:phage baseplate assembly protein [Jiella pelagia]|uniref:Mu-like prophage tail protein gpP n=1 Tax=Jiella pelagia TaxID=2986949 RepID=A0ABY7C1D2_9HYPH|nr:hypothetical protein [Jiella pelagia]WAP69036.1 hypothetical protein OH818_01480 [Jiella pelagia]
MADLRLFINGAIYSGWESVRVTRSIEQVAGAFSVEVSDVDPWPIKPGDAVEVVCGPEKLITGYVDRVSMGLDESSHTFKVEGRDRTADLVDCAVLGGTGGYAKQSLLQIAQSVAKPFGIAVRAEADIGPAFLKFSTQPGDTAFAVIERGARMRGLLTTTDGTGALVFTAPSGKRADAALKMGENIKSAFLEADASEKFGTYQVRGQAPGNDEAFGKDVSGVFAISKDGTVSRYRPLIVMADMSTDKASAQRRANWERSVRSARSNRLVVTVAGWTKSSSGALWKINEIVACDIPLFGIKGARLISGLTFSRTLADGTTTEIELAGEGAYVPEPVSKAEKESILA